LTGYPAARSFEYWLQSAKHAWRPSLLSSVLSPVLYLAALGVGLGALVDRGDPSGLGGVSYLTFVAPALLAATAMQIAAGEAGQPVRTAFQFTKAYDAMLATPLDVRDVLHGHLLWILLRVATSCAIYAAVIAAFGVFDSPWALLALPAVTLIAFAFAAFGLALTTVMRHAEDARLVQLALLPLFLFSTTFYPLSEYAPELQILVELTPLYHGIELVRALTTGTVGPGLLGHVAYLAAMGTVFLSVATRRLDRRLRI
jgi:lipooligosaccharide transport system permease protein